MGARFIPHPAPGPGAAPGSIAAGPAGPSVGLDDPEPISRSEVGAHRVLEDVVYPVPRPLEPIGRYVQDPSYHVVVVEQRDPDREPHAERMDGPRGFQQESLVAAKRRTTEQPAHPLAPSFGRLGPQDRAARSDQIDPSHRGDPNATPRRPRSTTPTIHVVGRAGFEPATRGLKARSGTPREREYRAWMPLRLHQVVITAKPYASTPSKSTAA
jgi:hypothetical protein